MHCPCTSPNLSTPFSISKPIKGSPHPALFQPCPHPHTPISHSHIPLHFDNVLPNSYHLQILSLSQLHQRRVQNPECYSSTGPVSSHSISRPRHITNNSATANVRFPKQLMNSWRETRTAMSYRSVTPANSTSPPLRPTNRSVTSMSPFTRVPRPSTVLYSFL